MGIRGSLEHEAGMATGRVKDDFIGTGKNSSHGCSSNAPPAPSPSAATPMPCSGT